MMRAAQAYEAGVWRAMMVMTVIMIGAGGLGASGFVALFGLLMAPLLARRAVADLATAPLVPALLAAAIAWTVLSLSWSPYDRPDQAIKLTLLTPLYVLAAFWASGLNDQTARPRLGWLCVLMVIAALYFLFEAVMGAPVSGWVKVNLEGYDDPVVVAIHADRILARGLTGFILAGGPCALALALRPGLASRTGAAIMVAAALAGGLAFGVEANLLAVLAGATAAALAWRFGGKGLAGLLFLAGGLVILAPVYMAALTALFSDEALSALPLSWHMRFEIWRFALEQIAAAPLSGHGLDAARVLGDDVTLRGVSFNQLPLHAHNAGLHIWVETGFIGAALFAAVLAALGRACWRAALSPPLAAGLAFAAAAFLATVMVGSGVWQEWLHGCLAAGCAAAFMIRR